MPAQLRKRRGIIGAQAIALAGTGAVLAAMLASPAVAAPGAGHTDANQHQSPETGHMVTIAETGSAPAAPPKAAPAPAKPAPASPLSDLSKPREQSFYGVSGGVDGLRGTIGLSEDGRQLHLGAGIGRPGVSIGAIDKLPDGLNANAKAGVTISKGNKASVKGKVNLSPDLDVSGSVGVEFSIDLGNGYKLDLSGSLAYKDGKWELSTSNGRTVPLDGRRQVTIGNDGKAKMKLPDKPAPWKAKPAVDLDGSLTANGTFDIGKALEAFGILDPAPTPAPSRTPNSVGAPDERAKAPNTSGSPTERDERNTANRSPATQSGKIGPAGNPSNGGRAPNSSGSPTDRDEHGSSSRSTGATSSGGDRNSASSGGRAPNSSGSPTDRDEHSSTSHTGNTASHHSSSYDGSKNSSGSPDDRDVDNGNTGSNAGCLCS